MKKKITSLLGLALGLMAIPTNAQVAFQGFEGTGADNWGYTTNIPFYDEGVSFRRLPSTFVASANTINAYEGSNMIATRDIDNNHSKAHFWFLNSS